jgi:hypothetical protein
MRPIPHVTAFVLFILSSGPGALAEQTVYKWVDEAGIVHFSDQPPDDPAAASTEEFKAPDSPRSERPLRLPPSKPAETRQAGEEIVATQATQATQASQETPDVDIRSLDLPELDRRCEAEREAKIAPLREAEIEKCITEQGKDSEYCNRFFADYGAGGRTIYGTLRPRMFHDLPVCLEAEKKRHGQSR